MFNLLSKSFYDNVERIEILSLNITLKSTHEVHLIWVKSVLVIHNVKFFDLFPFSTLGLCVVRN